MGVATKIEAGRGTHDGTRPLGADGGIGLFLGYIPNLTLDSFFKITKGA